MIKKTVTYENFDGEVVSEDLWFHLGKAKLIDMISGEDDIVGRLTTVGESQNGALIMTTFKEILSEAYGVREGSGFRQSPEISATFVNSLAFDELLAELVMNADTAATFINGLFPKDLTAMADQVDAQQKIIKDAEVKEIVLAPFTDVQSGLKDPRGRDGKYLPWAFRHPTDRELTEMTKSHLLDVSRRRASNWTPPEEAKPV